MTDVLVAIPAHDEGEEILACLEHLAVAVRRAQACSAYTGVTVAVSAHRCRDDTWAKASGALARMPVRHRVVRDEVSRTVGEVRARLIRRVVAELGPEPTDTWLLSTDADSHVPEDWIVATLDQARRAEAVAVAGMVELRAWDAPAEALARYVALVDAGLTGEGHTHVYGANLAVRLDAYLRVGGFRPGHGEDQDLVDRLRAAGEPVLSRFAPLVRTSARHPGRAEHGLGALLDRLQGDAVAVPLG